MYTIKTLFDEIVEDVANSKFNLNCTSIKLVQNTFENPITIEGDGTIYQDKNGKLRLKINPKNGLNFIEYCSAQTMFGITAGLRIIPKEKFFNLTAIDSQGFEWVAENIIFHSGFGAKIREYNLSINKLSLSSALTTIENNIFRYIVIGDFNDCLPYHKSDITATNNIPVRVELNTFVTELDNKVSYSLKNRNTYIDINIEGENLNRNIAQVILESTSIAIGVLLNPIISQELNNLVIESSYDICRARC